MISTITELTAAIFTSNDSSHWSEVRESYLSPVLHTVWGTVHTNRAAGRAASSLLHSVLTAQWCPQQEDLLLAAHPAPHSQHWAWGPTPVWDTLQGGAGGLNTNTHNMQQAVMWQVSNWHNASWEQSDLELEGVVCRQQQLWQEAVGHLMVRGQ